ncbi:4Fe-4S binding protein [bacterium]|nr:4Fe-4S binding protein [bacterium]
MRQINKMIKILILFTAALIMTTSMMAQDRFPRPEFETEYVRPLTTTPQPQAGTWAIIDVASMILALSLASYIALKTRSRRQMFILMTACLLYFGFIREGCICSVGSLQNIVLALFNNSTFLPWTVAAFFIIPLIFTLFFGRTFCAAVCPLGAAQDIVSVKHTKIPTWAGRVLGLIPYIYLGFAVLFAATGSAFIICKYDPFVTIFRFSGRFSMVMLATAFVLVSIFINRPYCRFFCPYGVLLSWMSRLARRHVTVTPDDCIQCRLCEDACPVDAINFPLPEKAPETRAKGLKRLGRLLLILPAAAILGGFLFSSMNGILSQVHPKVRLEKRLQAEETGRVTGTTLETRTFRTMGISRELLKAEVAVIVKQYRIGGWLLGIFLGLSFVIQLIGLSLKRTRADYEPDRANCISCARCFQSCPKERERLKANEMESI